MSSSKRVNQNDNTKLESPTLLSKLDQLDAQMKLAFPSNSKKNNEDSLKSSSSSSSSIIKSPTQKSPTGLKSLSSGIKLPAIIKNEQPLKLDTIKTANLAENKENVNEKIIKIDAKSIKKEIISPLKETCIINIENKADELINNPIITTDSNQQISPTKISTSVNIQPLNSNIIITTVNTSTINNTLTTTTTTTNKPLSAWKKTKILSKTLSSINVMKSRTSATITNSNNQTVNNQQQNLKIKDNGENQLKKSSSGNLIDNHHLNSPLNQIKRRSQEEVTTGLNINTARLSTSLSSSCQTSTHNLNEQNSKVNPQSALQTALNNLNQSTGTYHIPDNYNTTIINQLNKNYLKNIQKQKKAQSDWKSLKSKLIGLGRKENEDNITDSAIGSSNISGKLVDNTESTTTANTSQRKLSNSNQTTADDGIICKKEDLLFLLRNSALARNKQRRSNKPSLADVVVQLQESKAKKVSVSSSNNQPKHDKNNTILKNQSDLNENKSSCISNQITNSEKNNQSILNYENNSSIKKNKTSSNGRVQFVLSNEPQNSGTSTPTNKIKSSLKKTSSNQSSSIDKNQNSLTRQTKSNTINNMNLNKKKVKIYETDQNGVRKALMLQSIKDRNNNENLVNDEESIITRNQIKITKNESIDEDDNKEDEEKHEIKWDDKNVVDAAILGDAIAAFLSSITTNASTSSNVNSSTYSGVNRPTTEKKVSFKK